MLRMMSDQIDLDAFCEYVRASGGDFKDAHAQGGEVLRFIVGKAVGVVTRNKHGRLTFCSIAAPMVRQYKAALPKPPPAPSHPIPQPVIVKTAQVVKVTLECAEHERARDLLKEATKATVYTDGSCKRGGAGTGGWAAIIKSGFVNVEIFGGAVDTTINRMEIIAAIVALEILPPGCIVTVNTDSQYLRKGISSWIDNWRIRGWKTVTGTDVLNRSLWERLDRARNDRKVKWKWVPAHRGIRQNERADALAKRGRFAVINGGASA